MKKLILLPLIALILSCSSDSDNDIMEPKVSLIRTNSNNSDLNDSAIFYIKLRNESDLEVKAFYRLTFNNQKGEDRQIQTKLSNINTCSTIAPNSECEFEITVEYNEGDTELILNDVQINLD